MAASFTINNAVIEANLGRQIRAYVERKTEEVAALARATGNARTGTTNAGITTSITQEGLRVTGTVTVPFPGKILARGSRPHVIRARNARFLRFPDSRTGAIVYRRSVNHPGTRPYPYLRQALLDVMYRST